MRALPVFFALLAFAIPELLQADEKPILVLDAGGHTANVSKVLFTPDGKEVITVSRDKTIRFWDAASGQPVRVFRPPIGKGPEGKLYAAALSPDGQKFAVGGYGFPDHNWGEIYLLSLPHGRIERVLTGHDNAILALAFSADGKRLLSGSGDKTAKIWNVATGECEQTLGGHTKQIYGVVFTPDGRKVATASYDKTARIWDVETGKILADLKGHEKEVRSIAWSPDGRTIATGSYDHSIRLWDADGTFRKSFEKLGNQILSLSFTPNSQELLFTRGSDPGRSTCSMIDLSTGKERVRFDRHNNTVLHGGLMHDGTLAATTGGSDNDTFIWQTIDGKQIAHLLGKGRTNWNAAWSKDGKAIAWGNKYKVPDGTKDFNPLERSFRLADLEFGEAPDASFRRAESSLGSLSLEKTGPITAIVKQGADTRATLKLMQDYDRVRCFTLLPGDHAAIGADFGLYLFDTKSGERIRKFQGHTSAIWAVASSPDDRYLLSASDDQTLRIWDPNRDEPLLSLFFAGDDWIAWTPEGYYAASPGGEKLMGWHVNRGKDQLAEFHPAARFRKELYRPDVIKLLLKTGSVERALAEADKARGKKGEDVADVEKLLPPKVSISSPQPGQVAKAEITITATAESRGKHPVTALRLVLDGQQLPAKEGVQKIDEPKLGEVRGSWTITLSPGKHRLQVLADSSVSQGASDEVVVSYKGEQPMQRQPRLIVLAVGVSKYANANVGKLDYAASDAKAVAAAFEKSGKGLYHEAKVKLLIDEDATRDKVMDGLDWLLKETSQDDYAVVFFAGHGETDNAGNVYFLPVDADKERLRRTGVAGEELMKAFRDLPPSKRVLILDACHAGAVSTGKKRSGGSVTDNLVRDLLTPENGVVVMCSSTGREFSLESNEHRMGVFTVALTEGLSGKGPKDRDGIVFTHHLHSYVCDRVKELTKGQQHPVMKNPDEIRSFPVAKP